MATTTRNKQFTFDATRPFYAAVGAGDLAVALARTATADVQARAARIDLEPKTLRDQAVTLLSSRVEELQADAKAFPDRIEKLVNDYLADLNKTAEEFNKAYLELAGRGQDFVKRVRRQEATKQTKAAAETTVAKAKTTTTQAKNATKSTTSTAKRSAKSTTSAAKTSAKRTTSTAKKSAKPATSSAKATATAAKETVSGAAKATSDAASKAGN